MPLEVYLKGMLPLVAIIGLLNGVITPLMYFPAHRLLSSRGFIDSQDEEEHISDHSDYELIPSSDALISMEHLSYTYNGKKNPVLDDVNLQVHKGDFTGCYGGKAAAAKVLCAWL